MESLSILNPLLEDLLGKKSPLLRSLQRFKALQLQWALPLSSIPLISGPGGGCVQETSQAAWGDSCKEHGGVTSASLGQS